MTGPLPTTRRGLLATGGAALFAGCSALPGGDESPAAASGTPTGTTGTPTDAPPRDPGATVAAESEWTVTVGGFDVRWQVVAGKTLGSYPNVLAEYDQQFLRVHVETDHSQGPAPEEYDLPLAVEVDGERNPVGDPIAVDGGASVVDAPAGAEFVAFPVPSGTVPDSAAVVLERSDGPDARWTVPTDVRERFASAPRYAISVEAPDAVTPGESFDVTVAARNDGDREGWFRATLNWPWGDGGAVDTIEQLPVGEAFTWTRTLPAPSEFPTTLGVDWGITTVERELEQA